MLSENALLHFAYADYEETRMRYKKCEEIYKKLIDNPAVDPTLVRCVVYFILPNTLHDRMLQAYVQYMKFARRTEGIKQARLVFKMAREDLRTRYQAYVAAAYTEYYCSKVLHIVELNVVIIHCYLICARRILLSQ